MTAFLQEPHSLRTQEHGLIILINQSFKRFSLGRRQRLSLLLEVESCKLRRGLVGEAIPGGMP